MTSLFDLYSCPTNLQESWTSTWLWPSLVMIDWVVLEILWNYRTNKQTNTTNEHTCQILASNKVLLNHDAHVKSLQCPLFNTLKSRQNGCLNVLNLSAYTEMALLLEILTLLCLISIPPRIIVMRYQLYDFDKHTPSNKNTHLPLSVSVWMIFVWHNNHCNASPRHGLWMI